MAVYTRRGDKGETSLYDPLSRQNIRTSKSSLRVYVIGAIDELNSYLGVVILVNSDPKLNKLLKEVQRNLFTIGSILAVAKVRFSKSKTKKIEKVIDELEGELPILKNFILPGGTTVSAHLMYARALCRSTERSLVSFSKLSTINHELLTYLNRLSDFLFMLARKANFDEGVKEEVWKR